LGSAHDCEKAWDKLLKQYRALREQWPSGSAAKNGITWPYFDSLSFLDGVQTFRKTDSNFYFVDESTQQRDSSIILTQRGDPGMNDDSSDSTIPSAASNKNPSKRRRQPSADTSDEASVSAVVSSVFTEYFKCKKESTSVHSSSICPEGLLVDDVLKRLRPDVKRRFRTKLHELLAETEKENDEA